jgi:hypothetical protein
MLLKGQYLRYLVLTGPIREESKQVKDVARVREGLLEDLDCHLRTNLHGYGQPGEIRVILAVIKEVQFFLLLLELQVDVLEGTVFVLLTLVKTCQLTQTLRVTSDEVLEEVMLRHGFYDIVHILLICSVQAGQYSIPSAFVVVDYLLKLLSFTITVCAILCLLLIQFVLVFCQDVVLEITFLQEDINDQFWVLQDQIVKILL